MGMDGEIDSAGQRSRPIASIQPGPYPESRRLVKRLHLFVLSVGRNYIGAIRRPVIILFSNPIIRPVCHYILSFTAPVRPSCCNPA